MYTLDRKKECNTESKFIRLNDKEGDRGDKVETFFSLAEKCYIEISSKELFVF